MHARLAGNKGLFCLPFSKDSSLEDQLIPHGEVCNLQVLQQLIHNVTHVLAVAHGEQQVQTTPPDTDVRILQCGNNAFLMPAQLPTHNVWVQSHLPGGRCICWSALLFSYVFSGYFH